MPRTDTDRLTAKEIETFTRRQRAKSISDGGGLTLTVAANGYAAWVLRYRYNGKPREFTIGALEDYPLQLARRERSRLRRILADGRDPARVSAAEEALEALPSTETFQDLAAAWFEATQRRQLERPEVIERVLRKWIYPQLGKLAPEDIRPVHVLRTVQKIISGGAPTTANDARRIIRQVFDYGVTLGRLEVNPAGSIRARDAGTRETARTRSLSLGEIGKLLEAMAKHRATFGRDNEIMAQILLILGVRKGELIGARWSEIDFDRKLWTIPGSRIKTRKTGKATDFTVPLPPQAVRLFEELQVRGAGSEWVLPARRRGKSGRPTIGPDTLNFALADLTTGIEEPFTVHDLRRTMRSQLSACGISFAVAERCLNHRLPGQGEIYDRHDFLEERRIALGKWAEVLAILAARGVKAAREQMTPAQVVPLRRSA